MSQQEELQSQLTWRFTGTRPQSREHVQAGPRLFTDSAGCLSLCFLSVDLLPICEMPSTRRPEWGGNLEGTPPPLSRRGEVISIRTL